MADPLKNLRPWKPGQSGNPKGRPRKRPITEGYEHVLEQPIPEDLRAKLKMLKGSTYRDALALRIVLSAITGKHEAAKEVREAVEGKATQRIELTGAEDAPPLGIVYEPIKPAKPTQGGGDAGL